MLILSPVALLQFAHKEVVAEHYANVRSSKMTTLLTFALAEMGGRSNVTTEQLVGARMFANIFLNLAEKPDEARKQLPSKELKRPDEIQSAVNTAAKKK